MDTLSYVTFSFLSYEISYQNFSQSVKHLGLFPVLFEKIYQYFHGFIYFTGIIIWIISYLVSSTILSKITLNQLRGNNHFLIINGIKFSLKYWKSIVLSPFTILAFNYFIFHHWNIFISFKTIPILGPISFSILIPIYFIGALFILYSIFCFLNLYYIYFQYSFML